MDLFNNDTVVNILPMDGEAYYYGRIINPQQAQHYLHQLLTTIGWKNDETFIFGKHMVTGRKVAWYGDKDYAYTYSNTTKQALPWTSALTALKEMVEQKSGTTFNSCLLNLYHHGDEGMSWHSDDEKTLVKNAAIASVSLGAERKFSLKHKITKQVISVMLEPGSLLVMEGTTQTNWLHCLPKSKKVKHPRINLTFRTMAV